MHTRRAPHVRLHTYKRYTTLYIVAPCKLHADSTTPAWSCALMVSPLSRPPHQLYTSPTPDDESSQIHPTMHTPCVPTRTSVCPIACRGAAIKHLHLQSISCCSPRMACKRHAAAWVQPRLRPSVGLKPHAPCTALCVCAWMHASHRKHLPLQRRCDCKHSRSEECAWGCHPQKSQRTSAWLGCAMRGAGKVACMQPERPPQ